MIRRELSAVVLVLVIVVGFSLAGPTGATPAKKSSLLSELRANIDMDYAWQVMDQVVSFETSPMGFRGAGSSSAIAASEYVASEMTAMHLSDVTLEQIPVDAWEFHQAWVDVPGLGKIQAASFGGSPGTNGVLTKEIVDVGNGFANDYVGKDVTGKIVLANWIGDDFWVDSMAKEAELHGAVAIIVTTYASDYGNQPGAIECHDGLYRPTWPPLISISGDDGLKVKAEIAKNPGLVVSAYSDIVTKLMKDGGFGYNVVGYIPGKNYYKHDGSDTFVILGDHTDSWFTGGMDDTSGVAATLTMAKALKTTFDKLGIVPDRTIVFTTHEAEEYGILNTYYDWCYGAWYQITKVHTDWVGRTVAYMNFELMGKAGLPLESNCAPELASFVHNVFGQNKPLLPYGTKVTPIPHSWADHWTFTAAGVPGIELETVTAEWDSMFYHNQFDTISRIDPAYLANLFSVFADMALRLVNLPFVPYNFEVSATNLWSTLTTSDDFSVDQLYPVYEKYGVDPNANMGRAVDAASRYAADVAVLKTKLSKADPANAAEINAKLMSIEAVLGQTLIAQGVWEQDWYPYQQSANDVIHMNNGIEMLKSYGNGYDVNDGIGELNWVGIIWYYDYMSEANYLDQYSRLCGAEVASWGLQTHLLPAVEIWDEYDGLTQLAHQKGLTMSALEPLIHSLETKMVTQALHNLDLSFATMYTGLENVDGQIESLIGTL